MISSSIPPLALVEVEAIQKKNVEINYSYLQNGISHGNVQSQCDSTSLPPVKPLSLHRALVGSCVLFVLSPLLGVAKDVNYKFSVLHMVVCPSQQKSCKHSTQLGLEVNEC
jgi:hypothetical protein